MDYIVYVAGWGYYGGQNQKYRDMWNATSRILAKRLEYKEAERIRDWLLNGKYEAKIEKLKEYDKYTYFRHKKSGNIHLFYGCYHDVMREYSFDDLKEYDPNPLSFEDLDANALSELLSNIYENRNWHKSLYRVSILVSSIQNNADEKTATNILRQYILKLEE